MSDRASARASRDDGAALAPSTPDPRLAGCAQRSGSRVGRRWTGPAVPLYLTLERGTPPTSTRAGSRRVRTEQGRRHHRSSSAPPGTWRSVVTPPPAQCTHRPPARPVQARPTPVDRPGLVRNAVPCRPAPVSRTGTLRSWMRPSPPGRHGSRCCRMTGPVTIRRCSQARSPRTTSDTRFTSGKESEPPNRTRPGSRPTGGAPGEPIRGPRPGSESRPAVVEGPRHQRRRSTCPRHESVAWQLTASARSGPSGPAGRGSPLRQA